MSVELINVDWPAPPHIRTFCSTRIGGVSKGPFDSLNLSTAGGDDESMVAENLTRLQKKAALPHRARWPRQVHGTTSVEAITVHSTLDADSVFTHTPAQLCTVRSADCLPVLLCNRAGTSVAAAHAGWRGLAAGVLESTIAAMACKSEPLLAWLGPAISQPAYEVGDEVREAFMLEQEQAASAFVASRPGHWFVDLYQLARQRLNRCGVSAIYGGQHCTFTDKERFFSYRRDGVTGRMACGIWIDG